jgi:hypothetical protein
VSIDVTASAAPITVSASGTKIDANVTGGVGPQGPAGPPGPSGASDLTITGGTVSPLVLELTQQVAP